MTGLRIVDVGTVGAMRSQSLWHGIASAMSPNSVPTLSFCHPGEAYVCLGYHRSLEEIDAAACREQGLSVIRRQIGGGPVYIDRDQLFFQITLPSDQAPARVDRLYKRFLAPAVAAFRQLGLPAQLRGLNDIAVDDRRLSGTGAGQIGDAVTVVGNIIFRFPHQRMAELLAVPTDRMRRECLRLMCRHVSSLEAEGLSAITLEQVKETLIASYSERLGLSPFRDSLTATEEQAVARWEGRFAQPQWLDGPRLAERTGRQVKICADVWVYASKKNGISIEASVVGDLLEAVSIDATHLDGLAGRMSDELVGQRADARSVSVCLAPYGADGREVLELLEPGLTLH